MMTKPKEPHIANLTVSAQDLKVVISVNEYIEEIKTPLNNNLKNDFRYAARLSPEFYDFTIMPYWLVEMHFKDDFMTISKQSITH